MKVLVAVVIVLAVAAEAEVSIKTNKDKIQKNTVEKKSDLSDFSESIAAATVAAPYPALARLTRKLTCLTKEMNAVRVCEELLVKQGHCLYGNKMLHYSLICGYCLILYKFRTLQRL